MPDVEVKADFANPSFPPSSLYLLLPLHILGLSSFLLLPDLETSPLESGVHLDYSVNDWQPFNALPPPFLSILLTSSTWPQSWASETGIMNLWGYLVMLQGGRQSQRISRCTSLEHPFYSTMRKQLSMKINIGVL